MTRGQNANKAKPVPAGNLMEKPQGVSSVSSCAFCMGVGAPLVPQQSHPVPHVFRMGGPCGLPSPWWFPKWFYRSTGGTVALAPALVLPYGCPEVHIIQNAWEDTEDITGGFPV